MYTKLPHLTLGFHGCSAEICQKVLKENEVLKASTNRYDWLGNGIYFWENSYVRALEWAKEKYESDGIEYDVIGAVIDLGYCLNLSDSQFNSILKTGYNVLVSRLGDADLPRNHRKKGNDILLRDLDCAVIQQIHEYNEGSDENSFDSVRGLFIEGEPIYAGSCFVSKSHIQLCIRNPNCIKGYFAPLAADENYLMP